MQRLNFLYDTGHFALETNANEIGRHPFNTLSQASLDKQGMLVRYNNPFSLNILQNA